VVGWCGGRLTQADRPRDQRLLQFPKPLFRGVLGFPPDADLARQPIPLMCQVGRPPFGPLPGLSLVLQLRAQRSFLLLRQL
jgi:hypothetical protein